MRKNTSDIVWWLGEEFGDRVAKIIGRSGDNRRLNVVGQNWRFFCKFRQRVTRFVRLEIGVVVEEIGEVLNRMG